MSDSSTAAFHLTKTLLCIKNELESITGAASAYLPTTTLNNKYSIHRDAVPTANPLVNYFGIGIRGCYNIDDGNLANPYVPKMTNMDLYTPLPFRCVPIDEDLSALERANYRMRVRRTFNGQDYWCYYLKKISFAGNSVQITRTDPATQETTPYELDIANLTPTPVIPSSTGVVVSTGSEINVAVNCSMQITGSEVVESVGIIYGDLRRASISEIGIYTGEDRQVTGVDASGNEILYTESIYTQLALHYTTIGIAMANPNAIKNFTLTLGKSNVMLLTE
jgi:hypothetical protein